MTSHTHTSHKWPSLVPLRSVLPFLIWQHSKYSQDKASKGASIPTHLLWRLSTTFPQRSSRSVCSPPGRCQSPGATSTKTYLALRSTACQLPLPWPPWSRSKRAKYSAAPPVGQTRLGVFAHNPVRGCCFCLPGRGLSQVHSHVTCDKASRPPQQTRSRDPRERKCRKPWGSLTWREEHHLWVVNSWLCHEWLYRSTSQLLL